MSDTLLIRADASSEIGTGHVMRTLALAQYWLDIGGHVAYVAAAMPASLRKRLDRERIPVHPIEAEAGSDADIEQTIAHAKASQADWVILDGSRFGVDFHRAIRASGRRALVVDDNGEAGQYSCDVIVNQNIHATPEMYARRARFTELLLGLDYVLLRREFRRHVGLQSETRRPVRRLLLTMGGGDLHNATGRVLAALDGLNDGGVELHIVVGGANPHLEELCRLAEQSTSPVHVHHDVTDMAELMRQADLAVAAAGSTSWELAMMGLPAIQIVLTEDQEHLARELAKSDVSICVGRLTSSTPGRVRRAIERLIGDAKKLAAMSRRALALVDGRGVMRLAQRLTADGPLERATPPALLLRPVESNDVDDLYRWRNHPVVRAASLTSDPVSYEEHQQWFRTLFDNPDRIAWIGLQADRTVGVVRYDRVTEGVFEVNITIDPEFHGQGLGRRVLSMSLSRLANDPSVGSVVARIKRDNMASQQLFVGQGFVKESEERGVERYLYELSRARA